MGDDLSNEEEAVYDVNFCPEINFLCVFEISIDLIQNFYIFFYSLEKTSI